MQDRGRRKHTGTTETAGSRRQGRSRYGISDGILHAQAGLRVADTVQVDDLPDALQRRVRAGGRSNQRADRLSDPGSPRLEAETRGGARRPPPATRAYSMPARATMEAEPRPAARRSAQSARAYPGPDLACWLGPLPPVALEPRE